MNGRSKDILRPVGNVIKPYCTDRIMFVISHVFEGVGLRAHVCVCVCVYA